ncbi:hypothetical protein EIP91_008432 [Steccherinum ochraceum]|uniref:Uncharacterized protein n=1 Tax=Steccherinum ochraceum TaxID=92696 RepID=A0A4R0RGH6_9APHY|nr:hypothetical protein EIP91_008432 [Steccherinum ochraceum]
MTIISGSQHLQAQEMRNDITDDQLQDRKVSRFTKELIAYIVTDRWIHAFTRFALLYTDLANHHASSSSQTEVVCFAMFGTPAPDHAVSSALTLASTHDTRHRNAQVSQSSTNTDAHQVDRRCRFGLPGRSKKEDSFDSLDPCTEKHEGTSSRSNLSICTFVARPIDSLNRMSAPVSHAASCFVNSLWYLHARALFALRIWETSVTFAETHSAPFH